MAQPLCCRRGSGSSLLCCPPQVSCKIATALSNYSIMANYSWLLSEGHYLYSLVSVSLFSRRRHLGWYIVLGWGRVPGPSLTPAWSPL